MSDAPAISRKAALVLVAAGFMLFLLAAWLVAAGEELSGDRGNGEAHAAATGLNGYAGLVRLLKAEGFAVTRSRSMGAMETPDLLVLTPPHEADAEAIASILRRREAIGPTLVILPKWEAALPPPILPAEVRGRFKPGWVILDKARPADWTAQLPPPYRLRHAGEEEGSPNRPARWRGFGLEGAMPTPTVLYAGDDPAHTALVRDAAGRALAVQVTGASGSDYHDNAHWTVFVADADLLNNYGLADEARAAAAIALVREAAYDGDINAVVFDMTLNGLGASENLLTLAFRPPFLAATLCLLIALGIVGWRAFLRFGPATVGAGAQIAPGKRRLIANGAGLILRARRFRLLARPYAALSARRVAEALGLTRPDPQAIDTVLARRLPGVESFSRRAARLESARKPSDILAAARSLDDLHAQLSQGTRSP